MTKTNDLAVAMVQMSIDNNPMENTLKFLEHAQYAVKHQADIVVGSEMMLSHYVCGDRYEDDGFIDDMWHAAQMIAAASASIDAVLIFGGVGLDVDHTLVGEDGRRRKYNVAFVAHKGKLVHSRAGLPFAIKTLLPNYRIFNDSRHFFCLRKLAAERGVTVQSLLEPFDVEIRNTTYSLGVMLCEDMWDSDYALQPADILADKGVDLLINLSCSNWSWRKNAKRDSVIKSICERTKVPFVYVNNVGCQNNGKNFITFDGSSTIYNRTGDIVALCDAYEDQKLLTRLRETLPALVREEKKDVAQLYRAIEIGTHAFLQTLPSSINNRIVVGVSGGMDSALTVAFFTEILGRENVIAVNMPYKNYNAAETKSDAQELCRRLKVKYLSRPIDGLVDVVCDASGIAIGTPSHKTAQAMARMHMLAAIATKERAFFTCNANWTESFFGYGTLNGDLRGTFAPWGNCLKQDVYRLGDYMNRVIFKYEAIPQSIIDRQPMDELVAEGQGTRGDPFDYGTVHENGYHDQMVRAVIAFRRSPEWFIDEYRNGTLEQSLFLEEGKLRMLFPDGKLWLEDLIRCFTLYHNAVFKRVQSVPNVLVDKRSFGWDFRESILPVLFTTRFQTLVREFQSAGHPTFQSA